MGDKNIEAMLEHLSQVASGIVVTAPRSDRAVAPDALAARVATMVDVPILVADDVGHALDMARAEAGSDGAVLVTGSLYLVGEVRDLLVG
jgi:dihydrofolate synthase/folylpolyglutamate synthase